MIKVDEFTRAYITCALWTSVDQSRTDSGRPLAETKTERDLSPDTLGLMIADCAQFQSEHWQDIIEDLTRAGQDFWRTRNRHAHGFIDGDWPGDAAARLADAAEAYAEIDLYLGHDGLIYSCTDGRSDACCVSREGK